MTRVGFIGLGNQGAPIARRIVDGGFPLTIWARRPESLVPFADTPSLVAATPPALGAASDVVGICVVADADVEGVVLGDDGVLAGMAPGGVIAIHSTIHPDTCHAIATHAAAVGVSIVDAPVSGGAAGAASGTLLVMVGGSDADVERCAPVFATFGDPILHLGPLGSGEVAKLLNNYVFAVQLAAGAETLRFAAELGVDPAAMTKVLDAGSGASYGARVVGSCGGDLGRIPAMAGRLLRKDVAILHEMARADRVVEPPLLASLASHAMAELRAEEKP